MASAQRLHRHLAALSGAHVIGTLLPMAITPYLARTLGPTAWGPLLLAQGAAALTTLLVEYGFDLTGTRALAKTADPVAQSRVVADAYAARLLLIPLAILVLVGVFSWVPALDDQRALLTASVAAAVVRGLSPLWVFQGLGSPEHAGLVDLLGKVGAALGTFVLVRASADGWWVMALQALGGAWANLVLWRRIRAQLPRAPFTRSGAHRAIQEGRAVFAMRGASALCIHANVLMVGVLASPQAVTMFGSAERVVRAGINLFAPLTQALVPHLARASAVGPEAERQAFHQAGRLLLGTGGLLALMLLSAAPQIVAVLYGPAYTQAIPLLRGMASLPVWVAIGTLLGIQWAIPSGRQTLFLRLVIAAGVLNLALAAVLIPRVAAWGMVTAVTLAEAFLALALLRAFRRSRPAP